MLGGVIMLESEPGKGSIFSFTLPVLIPKKQRMENTDNEGNLQIPKGENEVILVAEDDYLNYLYLEKLITSINFQLIRAVNGREAVDICSQNKNIKLVLMDIKMPVMNGYEAMMMIKQLNPALPIVAQTAYALPEDILRIKQEGFDGHLIKPIRKTDLFDVIKKFMEK
jgi:CheY-like chemotaxis protein